MEYIIYCRETAAEPFRAKRVESLDEVRAWCAGWRNSHGTWPIVVDSNGEWVSFRDMRGNTHRDTRNF